MKIYLGGIFVLFFVVIAFIILTTQNQFIPVNTSNNSTSAVRTIPANTTSKSSITSTTAPTQDQAQPTFTAAQVLEHNKPSDCYMSYKGVVYDVTTYVSSHPGGQIISSQCGNNIDSFFHEGGSFDSTKMKNILQNFRVGVLIN